MDKKEALKQAIAWADFHGQAVFAGGGMNAINSMNEWRGALVEALTQPPLPEQEPVAHRVGFWCADLTCNKCYSAEFRFKHGTPPQRPWVGLTDEEIDKWTPEIHGVIRSIEQALKEKNT